MNPTMPIMLAKAMFVLLVPVIVMGCAEPVSPVGQQSTVVADEAAFSQLVLSYSGPAVVKFSTTTCGPCRQLAPLFEELAAKHADKARFVSLDTNKVPAMADQYRVWRIPTVIAFENGKEIRRLTGLHSKRQYEELIQAVGRKGQ